MKTDTQTQPIDLRSEEMEQIVLGRMIDSPEDRLLAQNTLKADDFFFPKHKTIFKAIKEVQEEKGTVDTTLLGVHLTNTGSFQEVGGYAYLTSVSQIAGTSANVQAYCQDMQELSLKRSLLKVQQGVAEDLARGVDASTVLERLNTKVDDLKAHKPNADSLYRYLLDPTTEKEISDELMSTSPGIHVGYTIGDVEVKIPGGAISILAAPTSHGKTATLINFALGALTHQDQQDKSVYFFSYEESKAAIISLFLNTYINETLSKNNRDSIKSYFRDEPQYINKAVYEEFTYKKNNFFKELIAFKRLNAQYTNFNAHELVSAIRFLKRNTNVGLICIDYMQLLTMGSGKFSSRQEELKQVCLMLKDCAVETGLPILLGAQFNRSVVSEADLSPTAIGEAGDIERIASMIIGFWNRNFEGFSREGNKNKMGQVVPKELAFYMTILKGRGTGAGHESVLDFNGNTGKLSNRTETNTAGKVIATSSKCHRGQPND